MFKANGGEMHLFNILSRGHHIKEKETTKKSQS